MLVSACAAWESPRRERAQDKSRRKVVVCRRLVKIDSPPVRALREFIPRVYSKHVSNDLTAMTVPTVGERQMAKKKRPAENDKQQLTFEQSLKELEDTVRQLEDGQLGLGESLARYEEGVRHLERCQKLLRQAERRIELLAGVDAEGNAITKPYDDTEMSLGEKAQTRGRRRSPSQSSGAKEDTDDVDDPGRLF